MSVKQPVKFTVDGRSYTTIPLTGRDAMKLDKIVTPLVFSFGSVARQLKMNDLVILMCEKLGSLDDDKFEELRLLTFRGTMFDGSDKEKSFSLDSEECFEHFQGRLLDMYTVMVNAWQAHKLTPFQMLAGSSTGETAQ